MQVAVDSVIFNLHSFQPPEAILHGSFEVRVAPVGMVHIDPQSFVAAGRLMQGRSAVFPPVRADASQDLHAADDPGVAIHLDHAVGIGSFNEMLARHWCSL